MRDRDGGGRRPSARLRGDDRDPGRRRRPYRLRRTARQGRQGVRAVSVGRSARPRRQPRLRRVSSTSSVATGRGMHADPPFDPDDRGRSCSARSAERAARSRASTPCRRRRPRAVRLRRGHLHGPRPRQARRAVRRRPAAGSRARCELDPAWIRFLNDAEAFLLGESVAGAARGHAPRVGITLGTGLGSAFLADGEIVRSGPDVPPERRPARRSSSAARPSRMRSRVARQRTLRRAAPTPPRSPRAPSAGDAVRDRRVRVVRRTTSRICLEPVAAALSGPPPRRRRIDRARVAALRRSAAADRHRRRPPRRRRAARRRRVRRRVDEWQSVTRCRSTRHSRSLSTSS